MVSINNKIIVRALLKAIIWGFTYYLIRHVMNPAVEKEKYATDAFYGAVSQFFSNILLPILSEIFLT